MTETWKHSRYPMHVVVACQVFFPDEQSTSQLLSGVMAELSKKDYRVCVITGFPIVCSDTSITPVSEVWNGIEIHRVGRRAAGKKNIFTRAVTYITFTLGLIGFLFRLPRHSKILVVTNPPFLPALISLLAPLWGHSVKVILQDVYPEGLGAVGKISPHGLLHRCWSGINKIAYLKSNEVWVLGRDMKALVAKRYHLPECRIRVIPHWSAVEFDEVVQAELTATFERYNLKGKFVVQYSGNMGLWHDIKTIVKAAARLREFHNIIFVLIGSGIERQPAEALSRELGLNNIIWLQYQPKQFLKDSLSACHVSLISQRDGLEGIAVPCKLYGILAAGRGVIGQVPRQSEVAFVLEEESCGVVVAPGDDKQLADAIVKLSQSPAEVTQMGIRAFTAYQNKYSLRHGVSGFEAGLRNWVQ